MAGLRHRKLGILFLLVNVERSVMCALIAQLSAELRIAREQICDMDSPLSAFLILLSSGHISTVPGILPSSQGLTASKMAFAAQTQTVCGGRTTVNNIASAPTRYYLRCSTMPGARTFAP